LRDTNEEVQNMDVIVAQSQWIVILC